MKKSAKSNIKRTQTAILMITSIVIGVLVWWQVINRFVDPLKWPTIPSLLYAVVQIRGVILNYIGMSVQRTILGYIVGCCLGVIIAYLMSWSKFINAIVTPYLEILRPIPALALIPFFIIWFGIGNLGKVLTHYGFKAKYYDTGFPTGQTFENIVKLIKKYTFSIFDTKDTDRKPNVYIEIGAAHVLKKPYLIFQDTGSKAAEFPSDFDGFLTIRYKNYKGLFKEFSKRLPFFLLNI